MSKFGIEGEPVIRESIEDSADLVTFSGDKLLGGPQAGLIVGRAELIDRMRRNPMYRALRADKLRLAALEATLESHSRSDSVPTLAMIAAPIAEIRARVEAFVKRVGDVIGSTLSFDLLEEQSAVGGGAAPMSPLPTMLITIRHASLSAEEVATRLRHGTPPVVARIVDDRVSLDLRTVTIAEESELENALACLPDQAV